MTLLYHVDSNIKMKSVIAKSKSVRY